MEPHRDTLIVPRAVVLAALFAVYFVAGRLGLNFALAHPGGAPIWAPAGIAFAAFVLLGYEVWPIVLVGTVLVNIMTSGSIPVSAAVGVGNTLEGFVGAFLVNRFANGAGTFKTPDRIFRFTTIVALGSAPVSATVGVASLLVAGATRWSEAGYLWLTWWLGNLTGDLVVVPFVVLWSIGPWIRTSWLQIAEAGGLLASLTVVTLVVFGGLYPSDVKNYPFEFLCGPFFLWAAFRFGRREVATATAIVATVAVWGTLRGLGPFVRDTQDESLFLLQAYVGVTSVMSVTLAAVVAEHRRLEEQLQELAVTDPLTGLWNYRRLLESLRAEIARSDRTGRPFAVVFFDMNGLKRINDEHGHLAGSRALCRVANALRRSCRTTDLPARFGGDEFAVVLPETSQTGAERFTERIFAWLRQEEERPVIAVSGGLAIYPRDGGTPSALLRAADEALYTAKTLGSAAS
jgi:diguanylate cyclase (GGDEF)-like protein